MMGGKCLVTNMSSEQMQQGVVVVCCGSAKVPHDPGLYVVGFAKCLRDHPGQVQVVVPE